jgi:hypothetical protein
MTDSRYTLTDMTGRFQLAIELDPSDPEPAPHTCQRAVDDFIAKGLIPAEALITDIAATRSSLGLRYSVSWTLHD